MDSHEVKEKEEKKEKKEKKEGNNNEDENEKKDQQTEDASSTVSRLLSCSPSETPVWSSSAQFFLLFHSL